MNFIEDLAPRGYDPYSLFIYPYKEGIRNITTEQPTLSERVTHCALGILLLIPLINTIAFLILRMTTQPIIFDESPRVIESDEEPEGLERINQQRTALISSSDYSSSDDEVRLPVKERITTSEVDATQVMRIVHRASVVDHLSRSAQKDPELLRLDGRIIGPQGISRYRRVTFSQVGGAHQGQGGNHLCGYYALFFMFEAANRTHRFADRDVLNPMLERWTDMIARKRAASWLSTHRDQQIPASLEVSVRGLSRDDMNYLIQNDPALEVLRTTNNCFVMEMDEYHAQDGFSQPITRLGNKELSNTVPLYFILKNIDMHYYFVSVEATGEFKVVHSMGRSIYKTRFSDTESDIIACLSREFRQTRLPSVSAP